MLPVIVGSELAYDIIADCLSNKSTTRQGGLVGLLVMKCCRGMLGSPHQKDLETSSVKSQVEATKKSDFQTNMSMCCPAQASIHLHARHIYPENIYILAIETFPSDGSRVVVLKRSDRGDRILGSVTSNICLVQESTWKSLRRLRVPLRKSPPRAFLQKLFASHPRFWLKFWGDVSMLQPNCC